MVAIALLVVAAPCTSGTGGVAVSTVAIRLSGGPAVGQISFVPITSIDADGNDIPRPAPETVVTPQGDRKATCADGLAVGVVGPSEFEEFRSSLFDSVTLAVEQFNAANAGCRLTVKTFIAPDTHLERLDTARVIVADPSVVGLIGPFFREQTDAMGDVLDEAGLAFATPNLQDPSTSSHGWATFVRGIPTDDQAAAAVVRYLTDRLGLSRICIVAEDYPENEAAATVVRTAAGDLVDGGCSGTVGQRSENYDLIVDAIALSDADAVYFAGYAEEAAALIRLLHLAGDEKTFIGDQGVRDARFVQGAGDNTIGTIVLGGDLPPTAEFAQAYFQRFGTDPEQYSTETYELASIMINGIGWGGVTDRPSMAAFLTGFDGYGSTRHYRWDDKGDMTDPDVWVHQVA